MDSVPASADALLAGRLRGGGVPADDLADEVLAAAGSTVWREQALAACGPCGVSPKVLEGWRLREVTLHAAGELKERDAFEHFLRALPASRVLTLRGSAPPLPTALGAVARCAPQVVVLHIGGCAYTGAVAVTSDTRLLARGGVGLTRLVLERCALCALVVDAPTLAALEVLSCGLLRVLAVAASCTALRVVSLAHSRTPALLRTGGALPHVRVLRMPDGALCPLPPEAFLPTSKALASPGDLWGAGLRVAAVLAGMAVSPRVPPTASAGGEEVVARALPPPPATGDLLAGPLSAATAVTAARFVEAASAVPQAPGSGVPFVLCVWRLAGALVGEDEDGVGAVAPRAAALLGDEAIAALAAWSPTTARALAASCPPTCSTLGALWQAGLVVDAVCAALRSPAAPAPFPAAEAGGAVPASPTAAAGGGASGRSLSAAGSPRALQRVGALAAGVLPDVASVGSAAALARDIAAWTRAAACGLPSPVACAAGEVDPAAPPSSEAVAAEDAPDSLSRRGPTCGDGGSNEGHGLVGAQAGAGVAGVADGRGGDGVAFVLGVCALTRSLRAGCLARLAPAAAALVTAVGAEQLAAWQAPEVAAFVEAAGAWRARGGHTGGGRGPLHVLDALWIAGLRVAATVAAMRVEQRARPGALAVAPGWRVWSVLLCATLGAPRVWHWLWKRWLRDTGPRNSLQPACWAVRCWGGPVVRVGGSGRACQRCSGRRAAYPWCACAAYGPCGLAGKGQRGWQGGFTGGLVPRHPRAV